MYRPIYGYGVEGGNITSIDFKVGIGLVYAL
jgi:hypothetical protein